MTKLYFEEANKTGKKIGNLDFANLAKRMDDYLSIMEKRLFE